MTQAETGEAGPEPGEPGLPGATRSSKGPGRNPSPTPSTSRPRLSASKRRGQ